MFTEPPRLIERIARRIDATPITDAMCRISVDSPSVRCLGELTGHASLIREMRAVGAPESILGPAGKGQSVAMVRQRLPYLKKIRNTGTSWRLMRILNDLYDYTVPEILEADIEAINERIAAAAADPEWARQILIERCRIGHIAFDHDQPGTTADSTAAFERLGVRPFRYWNATRLLSVDHPSKNADRHVTRPAYTSVLETVTGKRPASFAELNRGIGEFLDRTLSGQARFLIARLSTRIRLEPADSGAIDALLNRETGGVPLTDDETDQIASAAAAAIFAWAHENRRSIVLLGVGRSPHQPYGCPASLGRLAKAFPASRLVLADYSRDFARHAYYLASASPNIALAGFSDSTLAVSQIANETLEWLQAVPVGKAAAFVSQAPTVEWLYANLVAVRNGIAHGFAQAIEIDHLHENRIQDLLAESLGTAASDLLGL